VLENASLCIKATTVILHIEPKNNNRVGLNKRPELVVEIDAVEVDGSVLNRALLY